MAPGGRNQDRSRSRGRQEDAPPPRTAGSSEQEIVSVAIRQLPIEIRERFEKLFDEGLLKVGDLDLRSITVFASLNEGLQARVMNHMEGERIYVANARSKSGFLIATCDKAKTGCLDARGLGAIDPWRTALVAMATPKQRQIDLKPERDWLEQHEENSVIKIQVSLGSAVEAELGVPSVTVELPLTETSSAIKAKLVAMGVKAIPQNKMMLNNDVVGFLKDRHAFAFYNFKDGSTCKLSERKRGGSRFRADHTVMPKRPKAQQNPGDSSVAPKAAQPPVGMGPPGGQNSLDALKSMTAAMQGMQMPKLPSMPGLPPNFPGLPGGMQNFLGKMPAMPGMPGGLQMPGLPGGLGGLPFSMPAPGLGGSMPAPGLGGLGGAPFSMPAPGLGGSPSGMGMDAKSGPPLGMGAPKASMPGLSMPNFDMAKLGGLMPLPGADAKGGGMPSFGKGGGMPGMPPMGAGMPPMGGLTMPPPMMKGGGMPAQPPAMGSTPKGGPN